MPKRLKKSMKLNWNFHMGRGESNQKFPFGGYFLEEHFVFCNSSGRVISETFIITLSIRNLTDTQFLST